MTKGKCPHGEFELLEGCPQCIAERLGTPTPDAAIEEYFTISEDSIIDKAGALPQVKDSDVALIQIRPNLDESIKSLVIEAERVLEVTKTRLIRTNADLIPATEDLSLIAKIKKAIEAKRSEYLAPLRKYSDDIREAFSMFLDPIIAADKITRDKILSYQKEIARQKAEAEAIEREHKAIAERALNLTGEILPDVAVPEVVEAPSRVQTDLGTVGQRMIRKWELIDFAAVPDGYKVLDSAKITKLVKGGGSIPGIRVYEESVLSVNAK